MIRRINSQTARGATKTSIAFLKSPHCQSSEFQCNDRTKRAGLRNKSWPSFTEAGTFLVAAVYAWRGHDLKYVRIMKNLIRGTVLSLCFAIACMAYGAVPPLNVTVSDASGKVAFRGKTDAQGTFTTDKIKPGVYDVQFTSTSAITGKYSQGFRGNEARFGCRHRRREIRQGSGLEGERPKPFEHRW